jgi:hypothetical protein
MPEDYTTRGENLKRPQKQPCDRADPHPSFILRLGFADLMGAEGYAAPARPDEGEHLGDFR